MCVLDTPLIYWLLKLLPSCGLSPQLRDPTHPPVKSVRALPSYLYRVVYLFSSVMVEVRFLSRPGILDGPIKQEARSPEPLSVESTA